MENIPQFLQWLVTLDLKKLFIVLVAAIIGTEGYIIYNQDTKITSLNNDGLKASQKCDSLVGLANKAAQDCQNERINDANRISEVWRQKFDELEKRTTEGYQNIQEIRNNK